MNRYALPLCFGAALSVLAPGCASKSMSMNVLQPADVMVPANIDTIVVIDRSRAQGGGQGALAILEGALSGEAIGVDIEGRKQALNGAVTTLQASPRFDAMLIPLDKEAAESDLFDSTMSWKAAKKLCQQYKCQAIVALEAFDSDSGYNHTSHVEERTEGERTVKHTVHDVTRDTNVAVAWRLYDVENQRIVDDMRDMALARSWSEHGDTEAQALQSLPSQYDTVAVLGHDVGALYGARIAPTWIVVSRAYYTKGHDDLKLAKNYVMAGDWSGAQALWTPLTGSPDAKVRGRAEFNMAVAAEVAGDLEGALAWARKAAVDLANNKSRSYVTVLEQRIADFHKLQEQMSAPSEDMY